MERGIIEQFRKLNTCRRLAAAVRCPWIIGELLSHRPFNFAGKFRCNLLGAWGSAQRNNFRRRSANLRGRISTTIAALPFGLGGFARGAPTAVSVSGAAVRFRHAVSVLLIVKVTTDLDEVVGHFSEIPDFV